jgi:glycosyltransferase involved in cell wall biosynthesis
MGGTESLVYQMLRNHPPGFRNSAICLDTLGDLGHKAQSEGCEIALIQRQPGIDFTLPQRIASHAREHGIDILHCHQYTPWFYGVLARFYRFGLKVIFTEHGRNYPDLPSIRRKLFNKAMTPLTHCITAVSPATAKAIHEIEGFPAERIRLVFNGVDPKKFQVPESKAELRSKLNLKPDFHYFILVSRFDPVKWIGGLLDAFKIVVGKNPKSGLLLIGDGEQKESICSQVAQLGLQDHVIMPGYQNNVAEWLKAADVFVLSSLSEGTSVSLIESMAIGLPSVVTKVGGNEYVMEDRKTGLLVPPREVESLAQGMLTLISKPDMLTLFGNNARRRFEQEFQLPAMFQGYENIYRSLLPVHHSF